MTLGAQVRVVLSVDPQRFTDVVQALRDAGLVVETEYPQIGSVAGTIARNQLPALEDIDGVEAVERERSYQLPPPDSPLQ